MKRKRTNSLQSSHQQSLSSKRPRTVTDSLYLPDECWESIFKFIIIDGDNINNRRYLKPLSLVSKQFLSITNRLRFSLNVWKPARPFLRRLFKRFSNLNLLDFSCYKGSLDFLLWQTSRSSSNLKSLKSLNVSYRRGIPMIGLKEFSQNITTLTSLTCSHISRPQSIDMLIIADCFPFLEELDLSYPSYCENSMFDRVNTLLSALSNLQKVNLTKHSYINDKFLFHLFNSCKCLEEAIIFRCPEVTNVGIASALGEALTLRSLSFTNYFEPRECSMLFGLVKNSPSLSEIRMEYNFENSFETSNSFMDLVVRPQLKSLCLTHNSRLRDETIKIFSSIFPNLQLLDLINCSGISDEGICEVLRCCKIRQLNLARSLKVKLLGLNFEIPKLEVLNLSHTSIDDETLNVISKSCRGLLHLLLKRCKNITEKGVNHIEENCSQLREINLEGCFQLHDDVVASLVFSRPSLRKITTPALCHFSDTEMELFSHQGCLVC